jgi:hypothetical protein
MTLALAIIGTALGILNLAWTVWTWRVSGSRVEVEASFRMFPGLARDQMMEQLSRAQLPPGLAPLAQQMVQYQSQFPIPHDLSYPTSPGLMTALSPEQVLAVATIRNTGRSPVTILGCQWATSQPGFVGTLNTPPGVSFPHRLEGGDQCISVITLATLTAVLDAPLRDKGIVGRLAWPLVSVANLRKPVKGNPLTVPTRSQPPSKQNA